MDDYHFYRYREGSRGNVNSRVKFDEHTVRFARFLIGSALVRREPSFRNQDGCVVCVVCDFRRAFASMALNVFVAGLRYFVFADEDP